MCLLHDCKVMRNNIIYIYIYQKFSCLKCNLKARVCHIINSYCPNLIALPQCDFFFSVFVALLLFERHIKSFRSAALTKLTIERGLYRTSLYSTHVHCCSHITVVLLNRGDIYIPVLIEGARVTPCISQQSFHF